MAREAKDRGHVRRTLVLSREEAVEIIAFLAGQLAGVPVPNNLLDAAPEIQVRGDGAVIEKLTFVVEEPAPEGAG